MSGITKGSVVDPSGQVLANCKLFMYRRTDGTLLGSAVSDENGDYELTHQGQDGELVFMVCLDNDDAPNFEGLVRDRITLAVESDTTSDKVATHEFIFRTYSPITISASVNGSDFAEISTFSEISVSSKATDFGTQITVSMNTSDDMLVRLRASSNVCLFVNPVQEIDEVNQSNQSYTLYNANGKIDPTLEANKTYNSSYIDDSSTDQDYVVLFSAVEFSLTNDVVEKECDCTSSMYVQPVSFSGVSGSKIVAEISINNLSVTNISLITYDGSMDNLIATVLALVLSDGRSIRNLINLTYSADDQTFTTANKTAYCLHDIMLRLQVFDASGNNHIGTTDFIPAYTSLCAISVAA
ncbi:carboxypeptidase-like regulatory domain-containing protein [Acinetobacter brisouii]|uniref:carboxypeptidase-like regulatory domain-containing protein n=1 Tax=Acinetobacter brisouii TaxID=396323 RepID=UPI00124E30F0|nr:carboxypeptidase-like regulatory domain-containing protein [Acinetobacter brisouii]